ncbi:MAG: hypothetical protein ABEH35_03135 [Haloarculaceae archaeon]
MLPEDISVGTPDLVLAVIALALSIAGVAGAVLSVSMGVALGAGSLPASGGIGYALFYSPPGE